MFTDYLEEYKAVAGAISTRELQACEAMVGKMTTVLKDGGKVLIAGNGGSAADAQHFAAEFVCKYKLDRRGYPVIALTTDTSVLTAWANDVDFNNVFARQVEALGQAGDIFIGISTSGGSKNIIEAIDMAKKKQMAVFTFLGKDGGSTKGLGDVEVIVPSSNTPRIQEMQMFLLHCVAEEVEKKLVG